MESIDERTVGLIGQECAEKLRRSRVAVFGLGGVGGHAAEALARAGIGALTVVDGDVIAPSNLNRQLFAAMSTIGRTKAEVAEERLKDVAPNTAVTARRLFFTDDTPFEFAAFDYVVDAIDTVTSKLAIVQRAQAAGVPVVSCLGTGNKLDPTAFRVADIYSTRVCPLARAFRKLCRESGIEHLKVVYSEEEPKQAQSPTRTPASISFVPPAAGMILASVVVRDLLG